MANKSIKPVQRPGVKLPELTEEEIKQRQARFYMEKRESFAMAAMCNLCTNSGLAKASAAEISKKAVACADYLIKGLYVDDIPEFSKLTK